MYNFPNMCLYTLFWKYKGSPGQKIDISGFFVEDTTECLFRAQEAWPTWLVCSKLALPFSTTQLPIMQWGNYFFSQSLLILLWKEHPENNLETPRNSRKNTLMGPIWNIFFMNIVWVADALISQVCKHTNNPNKVNNIQLHYYICFS
jgi:hypothetical protein